MARARRARPVPSRGGIPPEIGDQLHPIWRDLEALQAHPRLGRYVDRRVRERVDRGGRAYHTVTARWAIAHGFESDRYSGLPDWHALRVALGAGGTEGGDD